MNIFEIFSSLCASQVNSLGQILGNGITGSELVIVYFKGFGYLLPNCLTSRTGHTKEFGLPSSTPNQRCCRRDFGSGLCVGPWSATLEKYHESFYIGPEDYFI